MKRAKRRGRLARQRQMLKQQSYPLYNLYMQKVHNRRRPEIIWGTDNRAYITFDNDWTIGRDYASVQTFTTPKLTETMLIARDSVAPPKLP